MTTAAELAKRAMKTICAPDLTWPREYMTPMGALTLRFSGKSLAHLGTAVDRAIDQALALTSTTALTACGYLTKGAKSTRYATPKLLDKGGRKLLTGAFATLKKLPQRATQIYIKDGDAKSLVPDQFALYVSLAADAGNTFATGLGFMAIAFPLAEVTAARWTELGDKLVETLGAEVAWLGPAIWLAPHCLFNGSLNDLDGEERMMKLFAKDPQLEVPSYYASRSPFTFDELEPDPLGGFLAPSWIMWATAKLATKVKTYRGTRVAGKHATRYHASAAAPFAMTETVYKDWLRAWKDLEPLHVEHAGESEPGPYYLTRFAAESYAALGTGWSDAYVERTTAAARTQKIGAQIDKLAAKPTAKLVAYADTVIREMDVAAMWNFLPALAALIAKGTVKPEIASVWLDVCEELPDHDALLAKMAHVAGAAGDLDRGIDLLARAYEAHQLNGLGFVRDPDYAPLRKHARWAKLVKRARA